MYRIQVLGNIPMKTQLQIPPLMIDQQHYLEEQLKQACPSSPRKLHASILTITEDICKRIKEGSLVIPDVSSSSPWNPKPGADYKHKIQNIKAQKQEMLKKLETIALEQSVLRQSHLHNSKGSPEMAEESKEMMRRFAKANRRFQKNLQKKDQELKQRILSIKQQQQDLKEQERRIRQKEKSQDARERVEFIKARSAERATKNQESNKIISDLIKEKQLFKQMEEKWGVVEDSEKTKLTQLYHEGRRANEASFHVIRQHEQRHEEFLQFQRQKREQRRRQMQIREKRAKQNLPEESRFYQSIKMRDENQQKETALRIALPKINIDKRMHYGQMIKEEILPYMILKPLPEPSQIIQVRSMSTNELRKKGNDYLQASKKLIKKVKPSDIREGEHRRDTSQNKLQPDYLALQKKKGRVAKDEMKELGQMIEGQSSSCGFLKKREQIEWMQSRVSSEPEKLIQLMNLKLTMLNSLQ